MKVRWTLNTCPWQVIVRSEYLLDSRILRMLAKMTPALCSTYEAVNAVKLLPGSSGVVEEDISNFICSYQSRRIIIQVALLKKIGGFF